ncbi:glycosyltransferase [Bradyrhizobium yuanmingense]|uniref:glycosyltransferase n=1 Tax=Bradyrhizobium yuanmingense TaxID=108015 RepID=UPI0012F848CB|nr:glycosyltransferase [Bradyrhizobium yuanmingense]MVT53321.1 glycosyltransferase [Bradyrhizobium yuanmingense]
MKILRIIGSVDQRFGGPIESLLRTAEEMRNQGHQITVASLDPPDAQYLPSFPFEVHALGQRGMRSRVRYSTTFVPWLRRHASQYDVAIVEGLWNYSSVGTWLGLAKQIPYVVFAHGMLDPWFRKASPTKHFVKQIYWHLAEGRVLRDADYVLFTCEEERRLARQSFHGHRYRERVVAFGTADAPRLDEKRHIAFRQLVPELKDREYLLFLGRIHPKKGCDILIRAFGAIASEFKELDLVIAGPDQVNWRQALELEARRLGISNRIHWPGMLAGDAKWGAFRGATAFVLPSHQENFGIAVAEALACGLPVLISNKVNIWREIKASGCGLVAEDTEAGTVSCLRQFLRLDTANKARMRQLARNCFLKQFEVKRAAEDLTSVLTEILSDETS